MPGSDEDAGTWLSGSILGGLLPHSLFAVSSLSGSQNESNYVEQESLSRGGNINRSTHIGNDAYLFVAANQIPHSLHRVLCLC